MPENQQEDGTRQSSFLLRNLCGDAEIGGAAISWNVIQPVVQGATLHVRAEPNDSQRSTVREVPFAHNSGSRGFQRPKIHRARCADSCPQGPEFISSSFPGRSVLLKIREGL